VIDWTSVLIQIPIVAVFIWYSRDISKQFTNAIDKRDESYEKRNNALVEAIRANTVATIELCKAMSNHDTWTHEAVELMVNKSKSRNVKA
jgi:hypothetical protein